MLDNYEKATLCILCRYELLWHTMMRHVSAYPTHRKYSSADIFHHFCCWLEMVDILWVWRMYDSGLSVAKDSSNLGFISIAIRYTGIMCSTPITVLHFRIFFQSFNSFNSCKWSYISIERIHEVDGKKLKQCLLFMVCPSKTRFSV